MTVKHGSMTSNARNLGTTRKRTGLMAIVWMASICSLTFMEPISAVMAAPIRPAMTRAVRTGPSSRQILMLVRLAT